MFRRVSVFGFRFHVLGGFETRPYLISFFMISSNFYNLEENAVSKHRVF
jgi:hypothetical protein